MLMAMLQMIMMMIGIGNTKNDIGDADNGDDQW